MNKKIINETPENITKLEKNEIFVFGSNLAGIHGAGAAKTALNKFGAIMGNGVGIQGNSFAIPTKDENLNVLPISEIGIYINDFINHCYYGKFHYYITKIGCELAGYRPFDIAPLFANFYFNAHYNVYTNTNFSLPYEFIDIIKKKEYVYDYVYNKITVGDTILRPLWSNFEEYKVVKILDRSIKCINNRSKTFYLKRHYMAVKETLIKI